MRRLILTAVAAALALTGCGGADTVAAPLSATSTTTSTLPAPSGTPRAPTPAVPTADAATAPGSPRPTPDPSTSAAPPPASDPATGPFLADTRPDTADGQGMPVTLTDIRVGRHDGFDRVVFDLGGGGHAGCDVRYVDVARSQGSGEPVHVAGAAILEVVLTNTGYPEDTGVAAYAGPRRVGGASVVHEVVFDSLYEGQTQLFVGAGAELPFRVYALDGRVVLEVAATG